MAVSNNHAHMLDNWLCHMDALGLTQILIVALDGELAARVSTLPYACVRTAFDGSIADLWLQRARVWRMLAEAGVEFIACDSDADWLRDPAPAFRDTPFDLLFSQATLHPRDVYHDWGFTLCCGLFWARPGPGVEALFRALISPERVTPGFDDQAVLNQILRDAGVAWATEGIESYQLHRHQLPFNCYREVVAGYCAPFDLRLGMLPHHLFPRIQPGAPDAMVRHVLQNGVPEERIDLMRRAGVWRLDAYPNGYFIKSGGADLTPNR